MRTPNLGTVSYAPAQVPDDKDEYKRFFTSELAKIKAAIDALAAGHLDKINVAPPKPRDGDIRYADGTNWKPNGVGGAGIWYYNGTTWTQLG